MVPMISETPANSIRSLRSLMRRLLARAKKMGKSSMPNVAANPTMPKTPTITIQ
jgi:hypothetical protein